MASLLNDRDLAAFLDGRSGSARIVRPGPPTPTVETAAAALGVTPERILKSLVFLATAADPEGPEGGEVPERAWLVIAAGSARIRTARLAAALGTSRRRVRLASPERAAELTGFAVGAMPPVGHRTPLPTLIDAHTVPEAGTLYGGGGARDALLALDAAELHAFSGARRAPLTDP